MAFFGSSWKEDEEYDGAMVPSSWREDCWDEEEEINTDICFPDEDED